MRTAAFLFLALAAGDVEPLRLEVPVYREVSTHLHRPAELKPGEKRPAVLVVGGPGCKMAAFLADTQRLVTTHFSPTENIPAEFRAWEEGLGHAGQDAIGLLLKHLLSLPVVDAGNVGIVTFSFGVVGATGALARHPDLQVKFLIDWEGPSGPQNLPAVPPDHRVVRAHPASDEAFWKERTASEFVKKIRCRYLRVQAETDHVQVLGKNGHAIEMLNNAKRGLCPWTRCNGNEPDVLYDEARPEKDKWLPGRPSRLEVDRLILKYVEEMIRMPPVEGSRAAREVDGALRGAVPDWPRFRGPNRDGVSTETGLNFDWPAEGPKALWGKNVGAGCSSIVVARGRAWAMGNRQAKDTLSCLDAETGAEVWTHTYDCPLLPKNHAGGPGATPAVDGDRVYIVSKVGHLFCLDAATGKVIWERNIAKDPGARTPDWGFQGSPAILGDRLYLNAGTAGLCLEKATGKTIWTSDPAGQAGYSTPVFHRAGERTVTALMGESAVRGVDAADGGVLWEYEWPTAFGENITDPFWIGERVFVSTSHGMGAVLLDIAGARPKPVWTSKRHGTHTNTSVLWKDHLYGFDGLMQNSRGRGLNCVDPRTGDLRWRKDDQFGSLMAVDGKLVMLLVDGQLVAAEASPASYRELARAQVLGGRCWTMPTPAKRRLYCRNDAGDLVCLDMGK